MPPAVSVNPLSAQLHHVTKARRSWRVFPPSFFSTFFFLQFPVSQFPPQSSELCPLLFLFAPFYQMCPPPFPLFFLERALSTLVDFPPFINLHFAPQPFFCFGVGWWVFSPCLCLCSAQGDCFFLIFSSPAPWNFSPLAFPLFHGNVHPGLAS